VPKYVVLGNEYAIEVWKAHFDSLESFSQKRQDDDDEEKEEMGKICEVEARRLLKIMWNTIILVPRYLFWHFYLFPPRTCTDRQWTTDFEKYWAL
tara:strand:- start:445 stop:729 length:285 start_codon:yes stop_codon:yes gene_type:complete